MLLLIIINRKIIIIYAFAGTNAVSFSNQLTNGLCQVIINWVLAYYNSVAYFIAYHF